MDMAILHRSDLPSGYGTYLSAEGLDLAFRAYPPTGPEAGLPVICLHGLTRNARDFSGVAPHVAGYGRRVFALDMRGRGHSARDPNPLNYVVPTYAKDVATFMDSQGLTQAVFIGTSMGGLITMTLAAIAPDRVAAAVLNDIGPVLNPAGLQRIAGYVGKTAPVSSWDDAAARIAAINGPAFPGQSAAFWQQFAERTFRQTPNGSLELDYDPAIALAFQNLDPNAPPADLTPVFSALAQKPVLVVRGALSDLLSPEGVAVMQRQKPDLDVVEVADVGHAPTLEEPVVVQALEAFFARVP